jgi:hypothetical protein
MPWKSPLIGYEGAEPLPTTFNKDGKSLTNIPGPRSPAYDKFLAPIKTSNNGFDFHIYHNESDTEEAKFAQELHERVRREFPELRIYKFWDKPVGWYFVPPIGHLCLTSGPRPASSCNV